MSDFTSQLFLHLPSSRIALFSCDHITPEANLRTLVLPRGPQGTDLTFKFSNMENRDMVNPSSVLPLTPKYSDDLQLFELGQVVVNFARVVPGGMVVFLPSYKTLEKVKKLWEEKGILEAIQNKKRVRT